MQADTRNALRKHRREMNIKPPILQVASLPLFQKHKYIIFLLQSPYGALFPTLTFIH